MSDYTKTTNFTAKDALLTGDANKLIKGTDHDTEYDAIATAVATKQDSSTAATLTGTETLTNKTFTSPTIDLSSVTSSGDLAVADGGTGSSTASAAFSNLKQAASTSSTGVVELATVNEAATATDTSRYITPALHRVRSGAGDIGTSQTVNNSTTNVSYSSYACTVYKGRTYLVHGFAELTQAGAGADLKIGIICDSGDGTANCNVLYKAYSAAGALLDLQVQTTMNTTGNPVTLVTADSAVSYIEVSGVVTLSGSNADTAGMGAIMAQASAVAANTTLDHVGIKFIPLVG